MMALEVGPVHHRKPKTVSLVIGLVVLVVLGYLRQDRPTPPPASTGPIPPLASQSQVVGPTRQCIRVIDGDTIVLDGSEHVRLIGVDTPETVDPRRPVQRFGKEASDFTRRMVEGKPVRLEYGDEKRDTYGRKLAYIYLADGTLLNAEIIRQGYGFAYTRFPHRRIEEFVRLERDAREHERGLWAP